MSQMTSAPAPVKHKTNLRLILMLAMGVRLLVIFVFNITGAITRLHLSPDSLRYHRVGVLISKQMENGMFNWPNWIDYGWFQITGFIYFLFGPYPLFMQLVNMILSVGTVAITFYTARLVFNNELVGRWSCLLVAFFPSFVYWSCMMLKDPLAIFAISLMALSLVSLIRSFSFRWLCVLLASLLMILLIRDYLFYVLVILCAVSLSLATVRRIRQLTFRMFLVVMALGFLPYFLGQGFMGHEFVDNSTYFDMDYINSTRVAIGDHGSGRIFDDVESAVWGGGIVNDLRLLLTGLFFFFVSIDLTSLGSVRQMMALPEVLIFLLLLPALAKGWLRAWRRHRQTALPVVILACGLVAVYTSATTNMGALFRWRMQAMPFFVMMICYGLYCTPRGTMTRLMHRFDRVFIHKRRVRRGRSEVKIARRTTTGASRTGELL